MFMKSWAPRPWITGPAARKHVSRRRREVTGFRASAARRPRAPARTATLTLLLEQQLLLGQQRARSDCCWSSNAGQPSWRKDRVRAGCSMARLMPSYKAISDFSQ
ncbi:hypothetical protein WME98_38405 [Sorangium sp. So ce296]|uniref:hypothetical protein n=1 Tax=Sorangium sp. So ce296 TaxID=3133296 RepID=UPI003F5D6F20